MVDIIEGWRCIGCGKIDAPQPCVGICQDRKFRMVSADDYERLSARVEQLEAALALIARITPRDGELLASWTALQTRARALLR